MSLGVLPVCVWLLVKRPMTMSLEYRHSLTAGEHWPEGRNSISALGLELLLDLRALEPKTSPPVDKEEETPWVSNALSSATPHAPIWNCLSVLQQGNLVQRTTQEIYNLTVSSAVPSQKKKKKIITQSTDYKTTFEHQTTNLPMKSE